MNNTSHALSVVELEFDRSAADLKRVEATLAKEFGDLYPSTSINPHRLLQRIENLRSELPYLERESDRLVSEKRSALAAIEALKATFAALSDTAARADAQGNVLAGGAAAVERMTSAAAASRQHIASVAVVRTSLLDESQLIRGGREIDLRLGFVEETAAPTAPPAAVGSAIERTEWASIPSVIASSTSYDAVQQLWQRLCTVSIERHDCNFSMSQLLALGAVASADDVRLHALGALRKISLFGNAIEVHL
ncbi:hypothetical protein T492DRAFT_1033599 [Pavlovales sp. CCMP2436]|nr:hypothetical protein T492DRAFT_1033599 [Pavlovales sp. CCMP2436]